MESVRLAVLCEMSAGMAHELKTLFATITLKLENLREEVSQEPGKWISIVFRIDLKPTGPYHWNRELDFAFRAET